MRCAYWHVFLLRDWAVREAAIERGRGGGTAGGGSGRGGGGGREGGGSERGRQWADDRLPGGDGGNERLYNEVQADEARR